MCAKWQLCRWPTHSKEQLTAMPMADHRGHFSNTVLVPEQVHQNHSSYFIVTNTLDSCGAWGSLTHWRTSKYMSFDIPTTTQSPTGLINPLSQYFSHYTSIKRKKNQELPKSYWYGGWLGEQNKVQYLRILKVIIRNYIQQSRYFPLKKSMV